MTPKIFNVRLNEDDQEHIKTIKEYLEEIYPRSLRKPNNTDVIKFALDNTVYNLTNEQND